MVDPILEIQNLTVAFRMQRGRSSVIRGLDLSVFPGEILAIVGESGSGKSVTAFSILGLLGESAQVEKGRIMFGHQDLLSLSEAELRRIRGREISIIFQEPMSSLNPVLSIGRQITEIIRQHEELSKSEATARATKLLELVSISDAERRLKQYPHELSGGMRQRVMIAIAIACNPKVIIADEATTALDVTIQASILELLTSLTKSIGASLILISHDLGLVAQYATRVSVMYAGKVVETAPVELLYRNPKHPYTEGLLASIPKETDVSGQTLTTIEGEPPDPSGVFAGCAFAPRCVFAQPACKREEPCLETVEVEDHLVACIRRDVSI